MGNTFIIQCNLGFAIAACRGMDSSSVIYTAKRGDEKLISFNVALKRCQDSRWMAPNVDYKYFIFSDKQKKSLKELKDSFRNQFEHFKPTGWSIEIHMLPEIVLDCLDVCRLLIVNSDVGWRLKPTKLRRAKSFIHQSKNIISNSQLYKEYLSVK